MSTKARVHSLIMADRIIEEKDGRFGVVGMFSSITLEEVPGQGPQWTLVVEMSGFKRNSTYNVKIMVSKPKTNDEPVCEIDGEVRTKEVADTTSGIFSVTIPRATYSVGVYEVSVFFDEEKIASRYLHVVVP